jgi:hypothetical protein
MNTQTTKIVWNGCDSYVECDAAVSRCVNFDGEFTHTTREKFAAFDAVKINPDTLPKDENGETDFDGIFGTETGNFYKPV